MIFYFSIITAIATWVLLLIGGIVNPMGASLACPDWYFIPTCNGQLLPEMVGGVLYEHGHRLWASAVGLMTLIQCVWICSKVEFKHLRKLALLSVFLVAFQGTLGGVTVLLGLSAVLSSLHLLTAMIFFCLLIYLSWHLSANKTQVQFPKPTGASIQLAFALVLIQILLGGIVRHSGAGLACGDDWISCGPQFWPHWNLGQLHMIHRIFGYSVCAILVWSNIRAFQSSRDLQDNLGISIAFLPTVLVSLQVALGLFTVATVRSIPIVVAHTAVGALVLAAQFVLLLRGSALKAS